MGLKIKKSKKISQRTLGQVNLKKEYIKISTILTTELYLKHLQKLTFYVKYTIYF